MTNKHTTGITATAIIGVGLALGTLPAAAAGLYKWVDDKGVVHYSDQLPPDAVNKPAIVLDKQGRQVKKIEPAATPAELKAKEAEDERQKAMAKVKEEKARKDLALLQSYTSAEEIDLARSRALSAVESQLKSAESYSADLARRQQELEKQKVALAGKPVPATLESEISSLNDELARQTKLISQKKDEMATIGARYDAEKRHWQEISADRARAATAVESAAATPPAASAAKAPAAAPAAR